MEKKEKNRLILTVMVCLLPIILGGALYSKLPEQMPIHFAINDAPDNYAPKAFALFGIPAIMAIVQTICLIFTSKVGKVKDMEEPKIIKIMEWFIPIMTVLIYIIMVEATLGNNIYVGKSVCLILGIIFMIIGDYFPKMSYEAGKTIFHPRPKSEKSFRRISKILGYSFISIGIILMILIIWA